MKGLPGLVHQPLVILGPDGIHDAVQPVFIIIENTLHDFKSLGLIHVADPYDIPFPVADYTVSGLVYMDTVGGIGPPGAVQ